MMARTPDTISAQVRQFCLQISPSAEPAFITITPESNCEVNDCFECIRRRVAREGGRIQFGWSIWEWPQVYLEAEHHAVYEPPIGPPWVDITPSALPEIRRRLFLPDDSAIYEFENEGVLRDNKRLALSNDPLIRDFFTAAESRVALINSIPGVGVVEMDIETADKLAVAETQQEELIYRLGMKYTPRNGPCFCGSGQKFKRCHGQPRKGFR